MLDTLLTVAGQVGGVEQRLLDFHAARLPREGRPDEADGVALRARALEALAHGGDRKPKPAAALAAAYLCEVLISGDPGKREPAPAARRAAVRGLDGFPGPETAECLRTLVTQPGEDPGLARLAVSVLGRLAQKDATARTRLVEIGALPTPSEARTEALKDLGGLAADVPEEARAAVLSVLRTALRGADPEARLAAASSRAAWLDGDSLTSLFDVVIEAYARSPATSGPKETLEERDRPLLAALERLVEGLAKGEGSDDESIAMGVLRLGSAGAVEPALKVATLAATVGSGRIPLQTSRAGCSGGAPRAPTATRRRDGPTSRPGSRPSSTPSRPRRTPGSRAAPGPGRSSRPSPSRAIWGIRGRCPRRWPSRGSPRASSSGTRSSA